MSPRGNIVAWVGVALVSLWNYMVPCAFLLAESYTNNVTEYNALLISMQLAQEIGVKHLKAYGDSKLFINQVRGEYEVWHEDLVPYHNTTVNMVEKFRSFYINNIPHQQNAHVDALASLTAHWLFQPEWQRKYLYTVMACTARNSPLKIARVQKESFKSMWFLRLQQVQN